LIESGASPTIVAALIVLKKRHLGGDVGTVRRVAWVGESYRLAKVYMICVRLGLTLVPATLISCTIAFSSRLVAMHRKWEEPDPLGALAPARLGAMHVGR
jgi:hypothetical protein